MRIGRRHRDGEGGDAADEVLEAVVASAQELGERYDAWSDDEAFTAAGFAGAVERIVEASLPDEALDGLLRDYREFVVPIAVTAAARMGRPEGWERRAVARVYRAGAAETRYLLALLAADSGVPVLLDVLSTVDESWQEEHLTEALAAFVSARVAAGDTAESDALAERIKPGGERLVSGALDRASPEARDALTPAIREWRRRTVDREFLSTIGRFLEPETMHEPLLVGGRAAVVEALEETIRSPAPRSVLLVGESGVGKSTLLGEVFRRLAPEGWVAFQATATEVNAGQLYIGSLEGRVQDLAQRMVDRRLVWVVPSFEQTVTIGQTHQSRTGLLDVMLPYIASGQILVIGEIDPLAYELVARERPQAIRAFEAIRVPPMTEEDTLAVASAWSESAGLEASPASLREALDLAMHYLPGTSPPGNLLRLLELTAKRGERQGTRELSARAALDTLSAVTGLPLDVLDPHAPLDLDEVRAFFSDRVLGQPEAVDCLVERIALVKAGLTDPTGPLGVFLFVGPTGTGKTEIAKVLAEFLFGSPDRLVRIDMSEYQTFDSLDRLLGDSAVDFNAAPLISSVTKQPFSVVLLDEFEKAHANVWDVFLQVFDDGRLTDRRGRTVDFRHCVIILTSNVGSAIRTTPALGFGSEAGSWDRKAVDRELQRWFSPEFLNRLDRVVVFQPLERGLMRRLLELELASALDRRGFRMHPWAVEWDEAAVAFLIDRGFSPELGARPLKRALEQHVLAPIAMTIVERRFPEGEQFLFVTAVDAKRIDVRFVDPDEEEAPEAAPAPGHEPTAAALALVPRADDDARAFLRAELERVGERLDPWLLEKDAALMATTIDGFWDAPDRDVLATVEHLDRLEAAYDTAQRLADRLERTSGSRGGEVVRLLAERLYLLDAAVGALDGRAPADAFVRVTSSTASPRAEAASFATAVAQMYRDWATQRGMRLHEVAVGDGTVLAIAGLGAHAILAPEEGLHVLELPVASEGRSFERVVVHVSVAPWPAAVQVDEIGSVVEGAFRDETGEIRVARRYRHEPSPLVRDHRGWRTGRIDDVLGGRFDLLAAAAAASEG